jgi:hypothetical protein
LPEHAELDAVVARLARIDAACPTPWMTRYLQLIAGLEPTVCWPWTGLAMLTTTIARNTMIEVRALLTCFPIPIITSSPCRLQLL